MFDAYSIKNQKEISINDVVDFNDTFKCLNKNCNAIFIAKAINSKKAPHFARKPSTPHIDGCPYILDDSKYSDSQLVIKSPLDDIYLKNKTIAKQINSIPSSHEDKDKLIRINTAKQLLKFCISNSLTTTYINSVTVDEIILDARNIFTNGRFRGVDGLRLILGTTEKYQQFNNHYIIYFDVISVNKNNKKVVLHAQTKVSEQQGKQIVKFINSTYNNKFKGHLIAVFEKWIKVKDFNIQATVQNESNIIYKFTSDAQK